MITNIQGVVEACRHTVLAEQDTEHLVVALLQHIALAVVDQVVYMAAAKAAGTGCWNWLAATGT